MLCCGYWIQRRWSYGAARHRKATPDIAQALSGLPIKPYRGPSVHPITQSGIAQSSDRFVVWDTTERKSQYRHASAASPVLATLPSMNEIARVGRQRGLALIIAPLKDRSGQLT
jgi:hypothetical protein